MASTRSILRLIAEDGLPPREVLRRINRTLLKDLPAARFVTMIYAIRARSAVVSCSRIPAIPIRCSSTRPARGFFRPRPGYHSVSGTVHSPSGKSTALRAAARPVFGRAVRGNGPRGGGVRNRASPATLRRGVRDGRKSVRRRAQFRFRRAGLRRSNRGHDPEHLRFSRWRPGTPLCLCLWSKLNPSWDSDLFGGEEV